MRLLLRRREPGGDRSSLRCRPTARRTLPPLLQRSTGCRNPNTLTKRHALNELHVGASAGAEPVAPGSGCCNISNRRAQRRPRAKREGPDRAERTTPGCAMAQITGRLEAHRP